ncbi:Cyclin-L1-1 [Quillaja saponaria]|uniref:Cyclin-L1-1 n=1 Tax=Quillaja saponaria TaxID=32244 RepID=A0AAD7P9P2_QUISA|nr:Cyclin-L1-1 [Quillaja saponaria]
MATGQVPFHCFYCKKSFARFNVKKVSASCVWLASKLEENPRKARQVLNGMQEGELTNRAFGLKYVDLKIELSRTERHILKEMGFICHVEHPHKFISNYLATLETPPELRQEAWNLAYDSLRTTLVLAQLYSLPKEVPHRSPPADTNLSMLKENQGNQIVNQEESERDKHKDRSHQSRDRPKDSEHLEKSKHHSSHDRDYDSSSYSSREKDRHRQH